MTWGFGKAILFGEHAVVYGHPALASALSLGVRATVEPGPPRLTAPSWDLDVELGGDHPVAVATRAITDELGCSPVALRIDSDLPPGAGLGSSAALSVAVTRAVLSYLGRPDNAAQVAEIANRAESVFHQKPSGVDVALAVRGGHGCFRRDHGLEVITAPPLPLAIGLSGEPRKTREMVEQVAATRRSDPRRVDEVLQALGQAAVDAVPALCSSDTEGLGLLMTQSQQHLRQLQLASPGIDELCQVAAKHGAHGSKLTGAGGGGAVIAVGDIAAIVTAWRDAGFHSFRCVAGQEADHER